jgi:hypothetical protein
MSRSACSRALDMTVFGARLNLPSLMSRHGVAVGSIFWCFVDSIQIGAHDAGNSAIQN